MLNANDTVWSGFEINNKSFFMYGFLSRLSYSHTLYTKLAAGAYACWEEVEKESGLQLVYKTGGINFSRKGGIGESIVDRYAESMDANGIKYASGGRLLTHPTQPPLLKKKKKKKKKKKHPNPKQTNKYKQNVNK